MSLIEERVQTPQPASSTSAAVPHVPLRTTQPIWAYSVVVVGGLILLAVLGGGAYLGMTTLLAVALFAGIAMTMPHARRHLLHLAVDRVDLVAIVASYVAVVALYRVAFGVIEGNDLLLFAFFASGMIAGVVGPVVYTVWGRQRSLATLGLSTTNFPKIATFALVFAAAQFAVTFRGYNDLPGARSVVTLLAMALVVGIFETIFFRGFIQGRLEASFGTAPAVFGAALLYGAYHVGYGMGLGEMTFLVGLGIVYALAYAAVNNFFIMWPLLTPLGSFFAQLEDGELVGRLPWAALLGLADVVAVMATLLWFARKHEKKSIGLRSEARRSQAGQ
jgi:uncharacterized protein